MDTDQLVALITKTVMLEVNKQQADPSVWVALIRESPYLAVVAIFSFSMLSMMRNALGKYMEFFPKILEQLAAIAEIVRECPKPNSHPRETDAQNQ